MDGKLLVVLSVLAGQIGLAGQGRRLFARSVDHGQQYGHQQHEDRNHDQQLDKRKRPTPALWGVL